jgi:hypothetical protein
MMASPPCRRTRAVRALLPAALALLALASAAAARPAPRAAHALRAPAAAAPARPAAAASVPDGAGGAYVAWIDRRDGSSDIHVLRVTGTGAPATGWPAAGVAACALPGEQTEPALLADPAGGVFVAWRDERDARYARAYYVQRLSAAGAVQWTAGGVHIAAGATSGPVAAADGTGGLVFAWVAPGTSDVDVFAGRLDATGAVASGWSAGGVAIGTATGDAREPAIVAVAGGAIVTWLDPRAGVVATRVYAQLLSAAGAPQWTAGGVRVDAGTGALLDVAACTDAADGVVVIWSGFTGVTAQRVDGAGALLWAPAGVTVATPVGAIATQVRAVADGATGAFVEWVTAGGASALVTQHLDANGVALWPAGGTTLTSIGGGAIPSLADIVPAPSHGAYFAWDDPRSGTGTDVYVQRVNFVGSPVWTAAGKPVCTAAGYQAGAALASDGAGGVLVTWSDPRDAAPDTYGQRIDSTGAVAWTANGLALYADPGVQAASATVSDGAGGAWSVWEEKRSGGYRLRTRHLSTAGVADGDAIDLCTAAGHQWLGGAVSDGAGGVVVAWEDHRGASADVYAQRVNAAGARLWGATGVALCTATGTQYDVRVAPDGSGGCIAAWVDDRVFGDSDISAQRVNGAGAVQWTSDGVALIGDSQLQVDPVIAPDGLGGAIIAWFDSRSGTTNEIYAQRLTAGGTARWTAGGVPIAADANLSLVSDAVPTGAGGALVLFAFSWSDPESGDPAADALSLQWVDSTGVAHWSDLGATFCDVAAIAEGPRVVADGAGGAFATWSDGRNGPFDVYVQHVTAAGTSAWTPDGVAVGAGSGWQSTGDLVPDGAGGVVLAWSDTRGGGAPDLYAQRLDAAGAAQWTAGGVAVASAAGGQYLPVLATDGAGGALVAWTDDRATPARYVYSARVTGGGAVSPLDGTVDVTATLVSASAAPGAVRLVWQVADAARVVVERRDAASDWRALATLGVDGEGRVLYVDETAAAGARLAYRLRITTGTAEQVTAEVWVEVPRAAAFALGGVRPNPATRDAQVMFSLPSSGPARLELFDPAGRRVRARAWTAPAAGAQVMPLDVDGLPAGVYLLRLAQGARVATTRLAVTR